MITVYEKAYEVWLHVIDNNEIFEMLMGKSKWMT